MSSGNKSDIIQSACIAIASVSDIYCNKIHGFHAQALLRRYCQKLWGVFVYFKLDYIMSSDVDNWQQKVGVSYTML
jgi:hypothetical protein